MSPATGPTVGERVGGGIVWLLLACAAALTLGAYAWAGLDFAKGVLVGSAVICLNFGWTKVAVRKVLYEQASRSILTWAYVAKLGVTAVVLYVAIFDFGIKPAGILVGVSALLILSALVGVVALMKMT